MARSFPVERADWYAPIQPADQKVQEGTSPLSFDFTDEARRALKGLKETYPTMNIEVPQELAVKASGVEIIPIEPQPTGEN